MTTRVPRNARFPLKRLAIAAAVLCSFQSVKAQIVFPPISAVGQFFDYTTNGTVFSSPTNLLPIDPLQTGDSLNLLANDLLVGFGGNGSFAAFAGSNLQAASLVIGGNGVNTGAVSVTGEVESNTSALVQLSGTGSRLEVGNWGIGTLTVASGAIVDATVGAAGCATASCRSFVGNGAGSTGTLTITGAGSEVRTLRSFTVGQTSVFTDAGSGFDFGTPGGTTNAVVNVLAGGTLRTELGVIAKNNAGPNGLGTEKANGTVTVDGAGSKWVVTRSSIDNTVAALTIGRFADADGLVTISGGGLLQIDGTGSPGPNDGINIGRTGGKGALVVTGIGSTVQAVGNSGFINVGGNSEGPSNGSFQLLAGATAFTVYVNVGGSNGGTGTMTIDGIGSTLTQSGVGTNQSPGNNGPAFAHIGRNSGGGASTGTVTISNGGQWLIGDGGGDGRVSQSSTGIAIGRGANSSGKLTITGAGSLVEITSSTLSPALGVSDNYNPFVGVGYDNPGTTSGTLMISAGGRLVMNGNSVSTVTIPRGTSLNIGGRTGNAGTGTATVTGAGSEILMTGYDAFINVGRETGSTGVLNVLDGATVTTTSMPVGIGANGTVNIDSATVALVGDRSNVDPPIGAGATIGRGTGGVGALNMSNGATLTITPGIHPGGMSIGGDQFLSGGSGTVTLSGGSSIVVSGGSGMNIGWTGTGSATLSAASFIDLGTGTLNIAAAPQTGQPIGSGSLGLQSASKTTANVINIGGSTDTVGSAGGVGLLTVTGAGSELKAIGATGFIAVGRNGSGTLTLADQGKVSAIGLAVGRAGGTGLLNAQSATIELSGEQTTVSPSGAFFNIGQGGGVGNVALTGTSVTMTNPGSLGATLNVGGSGSFPLGTGTLVMVDSSATLTASAGVGTVNIGRTGTGTATLSNSTISNTGGNVYVGRELGSVGTLALTNGSVLNAEFVGVGVSAPGTGETIGTPGGVGTLALDGNSTVYAGRFELGASSFLVGNGTIDAVGDVVIAGTVSPGYSPGRIRIRCNVVMLPGSRIVLEISGSGNDLGGYEIDQLIIGDTASFDLGSAEIVFSFLGDTNPNVVSSIGGLNLDYYLRTGSEDPNAPLDAPTQALSALFAPGESWSDVIDTSKVSAVSTRYDVTTFSYGGGGTFELTAVPVPEPSTWGLMFAGLCAVGAVARRRKAQAAQA
jgi:T5SS/PEP-CTERM-associated repeat protein